RLLIEGGRREDRPGTVEVLLQQRSQRREVYEEISQHPGVLTPLAGIEPGHLPHRSLRAVGDLQHPSPLECGLQTMAELLDRAGDERALDRTLSRLPRRIRECGQREWCGRLIDMSG